MNYTGHTYSSKYNPNNDNHPSYSNIFIKLMMQKPKQHNTYSPNSPKNNNNPNNSANYYKPYNRNNHIIVDTRKYQSY